MRRTFLILLSAVMMLLLLCGCGDDTPPPFQQFCSLHADGTNLINRDNSLQVSDLGKPFYVSDEVIFHLGTKLVKQNLDTGSVIQLSPNGLPISDNNYLAIDRQNQMLYFAAANAIYRVGFDGQNPLKLSPDDSGIYSAPALSTCGQYLTAIRDKHISRMDINTLDWIDLAEPSTALYAVYASDENAYYYYFRYQGSNYSNNLVGLSKFDPIIQDSTLLMSLYDQDTYSYHNTFEAQVSENRRYFAMQFVNEPWQEINWFGDSAWHRCPSMLRIYDRQASQYFEIPDSFCYAFVPDGDTMLYSRLKYGMADLMRMDMGTRASTMVWDGYYHKNHYSYSITKIFPRYDGEKIHLDAWKRSNVKIEYGKSPTAPM